MLDQHQSLPSALPHTAYDDFFAPDWRLHPDLTSGRHRTENLNTRKSLERIRVAALERLRYMHGAPSVAMSEIPPSLAPWMEEEDKRREELEDANGGRDRANREPVFEGVGMATAMVARPRMAPVSHGGSVVSTPAATSNSAYNGGASASATQAKKKRKASLSAAAAIAAGAGSAVSTAAVASGAAAVRAGKVVLEGSLLPPLPLKGRRMDAGGADDERGG